MQAGAADRTPTLDQLIRPQDLERALRPSLELGANGLVLFSVAGAPYGGATSPDSPLAEWEVLPAEAQVAAEGGRGSFVFQGHHFEIRPVYAGADRVGFLLCSIATSDGRLAGIEAFADAMIATLGQIMQSAFATWVTSEMHLAASESSYLAMKRQNAELQRAVEHLREIDKLKSNFLATVSHELRTPLTSVIGFSEMLLEGLAGDLNTDQSEYVRTILERGEELLKLITQILEMSRLEVGAIRLDLGPRTVGGLVDKAFETVKLTAQKASVNLGSDVGPDVGAVLVDGDKVHQVLVNLLSNAIKFTRPGGQVRVAARPAPIRRPFTEETLFGEEVHDAVLVTVTDTGVGIPKEQLERIFEAFYQVDGGSTREHGGAGLGLSIVRNLVTAHGGEVWAESATGVGTSFHFTLPVTESGVSGAAEGSGDGGDGPPEQASGSVADDG